MTLMNDDRPEARGWMYRMDSPQDLMLNLENIEDNPEVGTELLQLFLTYNANGDNSSDDGEDTTGGQDSFG